MAVACVSRIPPTIVSSPTPLDVRRHDFPLRLNALYELRAPSLSGSSPTSYAPVLPLSNHLRRIAAGHYPFQPQPLRETCGLRAALKHSPFDLSGHCYSKCIGNRTRPWHLSPTPSGPLTTPQVRLEHMRPPGTFADLSQASASCLGSYSRVSRKMSSF